MISSNGGFWGVGGDTALIEFPVAILPFLEVLVDWIGVGVVPLATDGLLAFRSTVSTGAVGPLSMDGCLEPPNRSAALEYLSTLQSLLGGLL